MRTAERRPVSREISSNARQDIRGKTPQTQWMSLYFSRATEAPSLAHANCFFSYEKLFDFSFITDYKNYEKEKRNSVLTSGGEYRIDRYYEYVI